MTRPSTSRLVPLVAAAAATTACFAEVGPTLPAPETLQVDLSALAAAPAEARNANPEDGGPYVAFPTAWAYFDWIADLSVDVATVPISALQNARDVEPILEGETWVWSVVGQGLDVRIGATGVASAGFDATMDVSASAFGLSSFLWLEGFFSGDATSGSWVLHDLNSDEESDTVLSIEWTFTSLDARILTFQNHVTGDSAEGDVLVFERNGTIAGAQYTRNDAEAPEALVVWDVATGAGYIETAAIQSGARTCWDETFTDRDCDEVEALAVILADE